jgi:thioredoxin reductase
MAELSPPDGADRPFPPGEYPVVVIGSGAGALQVSYSLRAFGVAHAVLSEDDAPGGMFRRWPFFQRLLSWTKPHAPVERGSRAYERYDWNSLLGDEPETRAIQPGLMDGSSYFPSRPEMERNLRTFAERGRLAVRYGCTWTGTAREDGPGGERFVVETSDGTYRAGTLVVAVGVARPRTPPGPGMEFSHHYADVRPAESYAGHRVFIAGKQNSGFELANGLLPWACQVVLASPSHAKLSVVTNSLVGVRARYVQPYEDAALGGGVSILDAAIDRVERVEGGDGVLRVLLHRTDGGGGNVELEVEDVIAATGFDCPLVDLPSLGVATFGASGLPGQTPWWESTTVPGIFFAGTIGQGAKGLQRHGMPSNSGAVHGARYNARLLAGRIAETRFGRVRERPSVAPGDVVDLAVHELAEAPELWHQKGYLARIITADPDAGIVDDGVQPLTHWLDSGLDGLALTLEADGSGAIYPALFARVGGALTERMLDPDPLLRYDTPEVRAAVGDLADSVMPGTRAGA